MFRIQLLLVVFLSVFMLQPQQAFSQATFPGSSVCEQGYKNLLKAQEKLKFIALQKDNDANSLAEIDNLLNSTIIDFKYLTNLLKRFGCRPQGAPSVPQAEIECKRCKNTGILPDGRECPGCNGDGVAWTPSEPGNEKACGRCGGTGTVGSDNNLKQCPKCNGSGWAHSQPDPPSGWGHK